MQGTSTNTDQGVVVPLPPLRPISISISSTILHNPTHPRKPVLSSSNPSTLPPGGQSGRTILDLGKNVGSIT